MHWVTTNGGKTFHVRRPKMILSGIKMHPHLPDCILASRLNDRCLGTSQAPPLPISWNLPCLPRPAPPRPALPCSCAPRVCTPCACMRRAAAHEAQGSLCRAPCSCAARTSSGV